MMRRSFLFSLVGLSGTMVSRSGMAQQRNDRPPSLSPTFNQAARRPPLTPTFNRAAGASSQQQRKTPDRPNPVLVPRGGPPGMR